MAWLFRVARNAIVDHYRRQSRLDRRTVGSPEPAPASTDDPFVDDPTAARQELAGCIETFVAQLSEPYRSAIIAVDLEGSSHVAAARTAGISVSGMKSRVQRGRRQLGKLLGDCCRVDLAGGAIVGYEPIGGCATE
jgi:RNA polymerase sigma-70 factor (ECF subfamily)